MSAIELPDLEELLQPIPGDNPTGRKATDKYDDIKESRRFDDPNLPLGDWVTEQKVSNWPRVESLSIDVLQHHSKDLQVACWLAEAWCRRYGAVGLEHGLRLFDRLIARYWEGLYPLIVEGDLDDRLEKLKFLEKILIEGLKAVPLTEHDAKGYTLIHWQQSKNLANLAIKTDEKSQSILNGRINDGEVSSELFKTAITNTKASFYQNFSAAFSNSESALQVLLETLANPQYFGNQAPRYRELDATLSELIKAIQEIRKIKGIVEDAPPSQPVLNDSQEEPPTTASVALPISRTLSTTAAEPGQREEALRQLNEIADFFRRTEPHSPVAYLVDRAAKWGRMPLEEWLVEVIKDENVLGSLRETLGIKQA